MKIFLFHNLACFSIFQLFPPKNFARETELTLRTTKTPIYEGGSEGGRGVYLNPPTERTIFLP
jgi:hypothetical protein